MAEEQQAGGAQPAEAQAESLGLLDEIMAQTRMAPSDEGYDVAKQGVQAFISELLAPGKAVKKADKTVVDSMIAEIDSKLSGQLDQILHHAPGKVAMRADWVEARRGRKTGHGSVFRFDPALHGWLYETLASDPTAEVEKARGSEQRYTSTLAQAHGAFAYLPLAMIAANAPAAVARFQ